MNIIRVNRSLFCHQRHWKALGLRDFPSQTEIKSAYLKKAKQYHPDKQGSDTKFREIRSSYEYLKANPALKQGFSSSFNRPSRFDRKFKQASSNPEKDYEQYVKQEMSRASKPEEDYEKLVKLNKFIELASVAIFAVFMYISINYIIETNKRNSRRRFREQFDN